MYLKKANSLLDSQKKKFLDLLAANVDNFRTFMSSQVIILIIFVISTYDMVLCHGSHSTSKVKNTANNPKALVLVCWGGHDAVSQSRWNCLPVLEARGQRSSCH